MKTLPIRLFVLFLAVCLGIAVSPAGAKAGTAEPVILDMLKEIPLSAFDSGFLSYADIATLIANRPGAAVPDGIDAYERMRDTAEGAALLQAYMGLNAGPLDFYNKLGRSRELLIASGIDYFKVSQALETGFPPVNQMWLAGDFDTEAIKAALTEKGYQPLPDTTAGTEAWCKDGDPASGTKMDLANRDTSFLFGGVLGQSWPVLFHGSVLGATRDENAVSAAAYGQGPSLADDGLIRDLIASVTNVKDGAAGTLAQLYLMTPEAAGLNMPILPDTLPAAGGDTMLDPVADDTLPPYSAIALAHVYTADAQWVVIGLGYGDTASAQAAGQVLNQRLEQAGLRGTGGLLTDRIEAMSGQRLPYRVKDGLPGTAILTLPFRFPAESAVADADEKPTASGIPYHLFVNMLMQRDLGWLNADWRR